MNLLVAGGGTGGHLYPGLAIARALVRLDPSVRPHFVGAERGIERFVLPTAEFPFTLLDVHPLYRPELWRNWRTIRGARSAWLGMNRLGRQVEPSLVVGTGGYASAAALAWGWTHGVRVVQHVGDSHPGATARLFARVSTEAYLGFPEAERWLPHTGCRYRVTGNPIEPPPDIRPDPVAARARWGFPPSARVLLVFGGSQGARAINQAVSEWIAQGIPESLCVLWATGAAQFDGFRQLDSPDVRVVPYLSPIAEAYAAADLALARGGTMGISELCAWGVPMIICPLPTAAMDHQTSNAVALEQAGAAVHVPQRELSGAKVDGIVRALLADPVRMALLKASAAARARPRAAEEIAGHILALARRA